MEVSARRGGGVEWGGVEGGKGGGKLRDFAAAAALGVVSILVTQFVCGGEGYHCCCCFGGGGKMGITDGIMEGLVWITVWVFGGVFLEIGAVPLPRAVMSVGDWDDGLRWGFRVATYSTALIQYGQTGINCCELEN